MCVVCVYTSEPVYVFNFEIDYVKFLNFYLFIYWFVNTFYLQKL